MLGLNLKLTDKFLLNPTTSKVFWITLTIHNLIMFLFKIWILQHASLLDLSLCRKTLSITLLLLFWLTNILLLFRLVILVFLYFRRLNNFSFIRHFLFLDFQVLYRCTCFRSLFIMLNYLVHWQVLFAKKICSFLLNK